jgi:hypothetical protein
MKKPAFLLFSLILIIVVLFIVRIYISNNVATSGVVLGTIQVQIENYKLENSVISEKLFSLSSLTNISQKAYDLGYEEQKSELVLTRNLPVAIKQ